MSVLDFLPKYPLIDDSELKIYDEKFNDVIYHKKEFYENRLQPNEPFPSEIGELRKYQKTIARYLSSNTLYERLLVVHDPGTGKTCTAIGSIELIRKENSTIKGAVIIAKGDKILNNFKNELLTKCTAGTYYPDNYESLLTEETQKRRVNKKIGEFYSFHTFEIFAKNIKKQSEEDIRLQFSNKIVVIDEVHNLRIQDVVENDEEKINIYDQFYRFLHSIENCKVICMSGTPMKDTVSEIASVMNLLLPRNEALPTGDAFIQAYLNKDERGIYSIKPEQAERFKSIVKGKVSFLREPISVVKRNYIGQKHIENVSSKLKHFIVDKVKMTNFQTKYYTDAFNEDKNGEGAGIAIKSQEASLFVYPNGSYGSAGFEKYIKPTNVKGESNEYRMDGELTQAIMKDTRGLNDADVITKMLENLAELSITYAETIKSILSTNGNCFVYCSFVRGSGCIVFSKILELFGFGKAVGGEKEKGLRYAFLTGNVSDSRVRDILATFNRDENYNGQYIKVIIGSGAVSEGLSFNNIVLEVITTPHWNYSETIQAIARGIRFGSHNSLIRRGIIPVINIRQLASIPNNGVQSTMLKMYEISEDKDISIRAILRLLMESAFDCALNYANNRITQPLDGQRECDYTTCNYKCDDVDMKLIYEGIAENDIDYSTYQIYYSEPKLNKIKYRLQEIFRTNKKISIDSLMLNLKGEFTTNEIRNAISLIYTEGTSDKTLDYRDYLKSYSTYAGIKISNIIERMFKINFKYTFSEITKTVKSELQVKTFEILQTLDNLINLNVPIINKYGFYSYLSELNNEYYLVNNNAVGQNKFTDFYTQYPTIISEQNFVNILHTIYNVKIPILIDKICNVNSKNAFDKYIKDLPVNIQELFIEASLLAVKQGKAEHKKQLISFITDYFKSYIKEFEQSYISEYLKIEGNAIRCLHPTKMMWENCDKDFIIKMYTQAHQAKEAKRQVSPYKIIGLQNRIDDKFCILDLTKQKAGTDHREKLVGKVCDFWKVDELVEIMTRKIHIPAPNHFKANYPPENLVYEILTNDVLNKLFTQETLQNKTIDELKSILYWGTGKGGGGGRTVKNICATLKNKFEQENLLEDDPDCGKAGKSRTVVPTNVIAVVEKDEEKTVALNMRSFQIYNQNGLAVSEAEKKFFIDTTKKKLTTAATDSYITDVLNTDVNSHDRYIIVYKGNAIVVGFAKIVMNQPSVLLNFSINKTYQTRPEFIKETLRLIKMEAQKYFNKPTIIVDNSSKLATKRNKFLTTTVGLKPSVTIGNMIQYDL